MSIKRSLALSDRSQPEIEQLTIWTFLERLAIADSNRVSADPHSANIIDLSNWIGSLDLESGGDALVTWGVSFRDRAIIMLDEWQLKSPLTLAELVEPFYDGSLFDDLVLGRMEWDLGDLVETIDSADYPTERHAAPAIASVSKDAALELADLQIALDTAHDENIDEWVQITIERIQSGMNFAEVIQLLPLGQVWLSVLLSDDRIRLVRSHGNFYDVNGLMFEN
jgi:hypothetical protein